MDKQSAQEHLKIARRLHFQGRTEEAISEYQIVLELDPGNDDAMHGLLSLGVDPADSTGGTASSGRIKTNFLANQAKEGSKTSFVKSAPFKIVVFLLGIGTLWGIYVTVDYLINFDNIKAMENVEVQFKNVLIRDDGSAKVDVVVANYNPAPVKEVKIRYTATDKGGTILKEGVVKVPAAIPAGDKRTFTDIELGTIKGKPEKMRLQRDSLKYGPKPEKLKEKLVRKYVDAASMPDKEALFYFEELVGETDEGFAPAFIGQGRGLAAKGKWDKAIESYKRALDLEPDNANAHYYMAVALFYKGDHAEARKAMDTAASLAPDDPEISYNLRYLFALKDPKKKDEPSDAASGKRSKTQRKRADAEASDAAARSGAKLKK